MAKRKKKKKKKRVYLQSLRLLSNLKPLRVKRKISVCTSWSKLNDQQGRVIGLWGDMKLCHGIYRTALPKAQFLNTTLLRIRVSMWIGGGGWHKHSVCSRKQWVTKTQLMSWLEYFQAEIFPERVLYTSAHPSESKGLFDRLCLSSLISLKLELPVTRDLVSHSALSPQDLEHCRHMLSWVEWESEESEWYRLERAASSIEGCSVGAQRPQTTLETSPSSGW